MTNPGAGSLRPTRRTIQIAMVLVAAAALSAATLLAIHWAAGPKTESASSKSGLGFV
jgi:hypothetical protein